MKLEIRNFEILNLKSQFLNPQSPTPSPATTERKGSGAFARRDVAGRHANARPRKPSVGPCVRIMRAGKSGRNAMWPDEG